MTTAAIRRFSKENIIEEDEFDNAMSNVFHAISINRTYKSEVHIEKKDELLVDLTQLLKKYLTLQLGISKKDKLDFIKLIDKMNLQRELLELQRNELNISQIRIAGKRLGKKAQSAFSSAE
ncbi:hypothetical protein A9P82_05780 [Arachidicoccus ginsenosidimutans]|uniref:hypothetical protein n=1 Tax=Arachidicoccus sp. BS20 TaxID=1850526 RepID=UPI0007F12524|nr:hypothetical protein [Arachidicoccus sp. BS20]ANI88841.1 hypothetical protein A9P82_05780 [Arachidicoccus sp. BS20]